ncbi:hypothetical protein ACJIZ3_007665 [Penstemon smallii]|uniref:Uncharacterized protein n=1 Tax=Penstemon smallii TaxID=265156 RepID=A0ABD3T7K8_9LAMI
MNLALHNPSLFFKPYPEKNHEMGSRINSKAPKRLQIFISAQKRCLRCNTLYEDKDNSPTACSFHGHTTGRMNLELLYMYKWNEKDKHWQQELEEEMELLR